MDWVQVQAIGALLGAFATFFAAAIALYLGLRKPRKHLSINVNFYEKKHVLARLVNPRYLILASELHDDDSDDRLLGFNVRNACSEEIVLIGFLERARFNRSFDAVKKRLSRIGRHTVSSPTSKGFISIKCYFGDMPYLFKSAVSIKPNDQKLLCVDYDCIKTTQIDRDKSDLFDLKQPLTFYALDADGRRYPIRTRIPAENFYTELTCTMSHANWLE